MFNRSTLASAYFAGRLRPSRRVPSLSELLVAAAQSWDRGGHTVLRAERARRDHVRRYHEGRNRSGL